MCYRSNKQENNKNKIDFIMAINFMNNIFFINIRPETLIDYCYFILCVHKWEIV